MIKARIGGHPIHMMLIHFPSAFYPMSVVCSTVYYYNNDQLFGQVAFITMAAGAALGWLAAVFGIWEALLVSADKTKTITTILWHASFNAIVTIMFTIWAVNSWKLYPDLPKDSSLLLVIKWASIILFLVGNYFGGKLVLKYRLGDENPPGNKEQS